MSAWGDTGLAMIAIRGLIGTKHDDEVDVPASMVVRPRPGARAFRVLCGCEGAGRSLGIVWEVCGADDCPITSLNGAMQLRRPGGESGSRLFPWVRLVEEATP